MRNPRAESDYLRERREQARYERASAMMEWRALDAEEHDAIRRGAHVRAGRLAGRKCELVLRLET